MRGKSIWTVDCKEPISRYGASGRSVTSEIILWVVVLLTFYRSRSLKKDMSLYLGKVWRQPCILFILMETNYLFSITIQLPNQFSPGFHSKGWVDMKLVCFLRLNSKSLFCDRCYMNAFNLDKLMNKVILSRNTLLLIFALAVLRSVFTNTFRQNAPVWILCRIIHVHMKSG